MPYLSIKKQFLAGTKGHIMAKITALSQLDLNAHYSYADYLTWRLDQSIEIIKGKIMMMSPAPNVQHQNIVTNLSGPLFQFFQKSSCKLFYAPFDVCLFDHQKSIKANTEIHTVVQPDLCIICDLDKLNEQGCIGSPDLIIEILSKGNSKKEMQIKFELYQESGVSEYWIVYPYEQALHQFVRNEKTSLYQLKAMLSEEDIATSHSFPGLKIDLKEVFVE